MSDSGSAQRPGGFWVRALASLIDGTLIYLFSILIVLAALGAIYWLQRISGGDSGAGFGQMFPGAYIQLVFTIVSTPIWFAYYLVAQARYGTTLGKKPFKLKVIDVATGENPSWGQSALRTFGYFVSYLPFGAGYLMALFGKERLALHDLMANTRVVKAMLLLPVLLASMATSLPARAGEPIPQLGVHGLALDESRAGGHVYGARIEIATKWQPVEDRGLTFGPRLGADLIFGDSAQRGHALTVGAETALWLMNAIGMGLGVEYALALQDRAGPENWWVFEPFIRIRTERLGMGGALVLHASPVYETGFGFGWRVGFVVEFSGVFGM